MLFRSGTTTLTGPVDPNYTYLWQSGLSGIANPNSFTAFGGTTSTQAVTSSANYRLIVTNQFGCSTSDTTPVSMADYVFNGSLATGDAQQTGRINRFAVVSTCAAPKACPGIFTATGARFYDSYTITNPRNVPVCATIGLRSDCGTTLFNVAYLGSFNPTAPCTNYLADPGSSFPGTSFMEATIPANGTIVVVVHEVNPGTGCSGYQLTVDVPRDLSAVTATPPSVPFNGTSTLAAPVANSYTWSPGAGTTQSITSAPITAPTKYYVTMGYGNNGCTRLDSVTVNLTCTTPTITCPGNISLSNTTGTCARVVTYTTTTGGTPAPTVTYSFTGATTASGSGDGSGSTFNVGVTNVTVTVTNPCGTTSCSFTVTINDTEAPTVTVGTIGSCYPTEAAAQAAALAATSATDNCPGVLTEIASTVGTCSAVVTVTTTDGGGNATAVTYNTRIDNTAPTVTVGTIGSCYPTVAAAEAAALAATSATDNCPGALTEVASTVGTCSAVVTVTTTDGCVNATAVTYNTRIDNTAPTVTCPAAITVCGAGAVPAANIALVTVTDNCPGAITVTHQGDVVNGFSLVIPYSITRTYRATDGCGNFADCTQTITVNPLPVVSILPAGPVTICSGSTTTLTASATCNLFAFSGLIIGTQSVPANASTARGVFNGIFNAATNQITVNIVYDGLTGGNPTAAHIHNAAAGVNGPVIIPFPGFPAATSGTYTNTFTVPASQVANLMAGNTYINIHNAVYPGGEIRGQITSLTSGVYTISGPIAGTQSVPSNASTATGPEIV